MKRTPKGPVADPVIYFIQRPSDGAIKIGSTKQLAARLRSLCLEYGEELVLLVTRPGTLTEEYQLHRQFRNHRIRGEWFQPHPELLGYVSYLQGWRAEQPYMSTKRCSSP